MAPGADAGVLVTATTNVAALATALNASGLTITSVSIRNGADGQFGTYTDFTTPPITIGDGVVLSSGDVSFVGPPPDPSLDFPQPSYDMGSSNTPEFDAYGPTNIENFTGSYDVAALQVNFHLDTNSPIKFDFIFGSVEYPSWTSQYTDALLVFLDGIDPTNQITFDENHKPVQVGKSFAGAVETADQNTAFADPHGVLPELTTTSALLLAGDHVLLFEVGDVNDALLDSAAFITNLRAEAGDQGTEPTHPLPTLGLAGWQQSGVTNVMSLTWTNDGTQWVLEESAALSGGWSEVSSPRTTNANWVCTSVTNNAAAQFFRLRRN